MTAPSYWRTAYPRKAPAWNARCLLTGHRHRTWTDPATRCRQHLCTRCGHVAWARLPAGELDLSY